MKIATPPPLKKSPLSFPATPLKGEVLSSPHFLKIWLEAQPPLQKEVGGGGTQYVYNLRVNFNELSKSSEFTVDLH